MFDISFTELMLVGLVALIVIGPERLPKLAKTVGHLLGRAQRYVNDVKGDIQREVELDELRKMKDDMESAARSMQSSMQQTESKLRSELQSPVNDFKNEIDELKAGAQKTGAADNATAESSSPSVTHTEPAAEPQTVPDAVTPSSTPTAEPEKAVSEHKS